MSSLIPQYSDNLEKQFFEAICLLLMVVMAYISVQSFLNLGITSLFYTDISLVVAGGLFYYLSRVKSFFKVVRSLFILLLYLACTFFWFSLNGLHGSTPYAMIAGAVIAILISDSGTRRYVFSVTLIWIFSLVLIQNKTDWVLQKPGKTELLSNNFIIFSFAIIIILYFIKTKFDKERARANNKNQELLGVNKTLNTTLSEKEEVIQQLRKTREDLLESEKLASIGKLTAGLAHELNNPLNYIGGVVLPLKNNLKDLFDTMSEDQKREAATLIEETEQLLNSLQEGSQKASDVIRNLVKLSPEQVTQKHEVFALGEILNDNISLLQKTHQDIDFKIQIDQSLRVKGNPLEIRQLCLQLLHNCATSLTEVPDKKIDILLKKMDKSGVMEVTDNGVGLTKEELEKVFDPVFNGDAKNPQGGIGMYMSYATVKKHFGQIKIESEPGQGTTVSVFLPLA